VEAALAAPRRKVSPLDLDGAAKTAGIIRAMIG
jgi:hypothetical protein